MGESFLISINCSKILADSDESQYTMFIDTSKMSIVYELAEWIRWIFSLENCFCIMHNNSVIHELEDIQVLSRLKNFELRPCERSNCMHQRVYRKLLKNLNLFVSWNGIEVHKYFLQKLNRVDQTFIQESNMDSPMIFTTGTEDLQSYVGYKNSKIDNAKNTDQATQKFSFSCKNSLAKTSNASMSPVKKRPLIDKLDVTANGESPMEMNYCFNQKLNCTKENIRNSNDKSGCLKESNFEASENINSETKRTDAENLINANSNANSVKFELSAAQEPNKNYGKSYSRKYAKPFSLGEILSSIREQNKEPKVEKNSPLSNHSYSKEGDFDGNMSARENSFIDESKKIKRKRTRKRKSKRKNLDDEFFSHFLDKSRPDCPQEVEIGMTKPNHIRFDTDEEDNLMETDYVQVEPKAEKQNQHEISNEELNNSSAFLNNIFKELSSVAAGDNTQCPSATALVSCGLNNSKIKQDCQVVTQFPNEDGLDYKACGINNHSYTTENFQPKSCDLNMLLSLKEKFKNAVIIERFY